MLCMIICMFMFILFPILIFTINFISSMKLNKNREKSTPFECGFDPITNSHMPFSINFFIMTLLFLIFDVEVILILPIFELLENLPMIALSTFFMFMMILIISLWYEWLSNYFNWIF